MNEKLEKLNQEIEKTEARLRRAQKPADAVLLLMSVNKLVLF